MTYKVSTILVDRVTANITLAGGGTNWDGPVACPTGAYCKNDGIKYVLAGLIHHSQVMLIPQQRVVFSMRCSGSK